MGPTPPTILSRVFRLLSPVSCILHFISNKHRSAVNVDYKPGQKIVTHQFKRE
jgi:hypothetical protein